MKWTLPDSTNEKPTMVPDSGTMQSNPSSFTSTLFRYVMRRKLIRYERNRTVRLSACAKRKNCFGGIDSHQARRILNPIAKEELADIQIKLAILSDIDGDRPIHIAVVKKDVKLVQKLCLLMSKNNISVDITNYSRQTPLHLAVIVGNVEIIQLLLNFGASSILRDRNGNTILHLCVKSHTDETVLHHLLSNNQVKDILNSMDYEGYSALHYAVFKKNTNAVKMLKASGADMNKIDGKSGRTPLIHAVLEQNIDMVELLLNSDASPQKADYSGRSAFDMAVQIVNVPIIELLEKRMPNNDVASIKEKKPKIHHGAKIKRTKNCN